MPSETTNHIAQKTDLELILLYKEQDDPKLLGVLYKRYMPLVFGVCLKYLGERELAKDTTMQVFEKLLLSLKNHEVENFKSWLHVLTKNECLMLLRKQKRQTEKINGELVMEFSLAQHHNNEPEELEHDLGKMDECMERLNNEQKTCIKLFYLEKKSYQQIVEQTDFELKKVKSHIQNGRRNLKICIEQLREQEA